LHLKRFHGRAKAKVANRVHVKAQCKWDKLIIVVEQCSPLRKPTFVKLISQQLLQVLVFNACGMGSVP